jgi:uncharacterized protein
MSPSTTVRRKPERASSDRGVVHAIFDEALYCDVGVVRDGGPVVLPTFHGRIRDTIYLHGSPAAGMLRDGRRGLALCVTATVVDGLVLAASVRNHSMNYRSAVVFGTGRRVVDEAEKMAALEAITDRLTPGRWAAARQPTARELREVEVIALDVEAASAKIRTGPPHDDPADAGLDVWRGVVPITLCRGEPVPGQGGTPPPRHPPRTGTAR